MELLLNREVSNRKLDSIQKERIKWYGEEC